MCASVYLLRCVCLCVCTHGTCVHMTRHACVLCFIYFNLFLDPGQGKNTDLGR